MAFGSVNTPGAWLVAVKNQLKEIVAEIGSMGKAIKGLTAADVGASPTGHKHTKSEITDFPTSLPASDVYAWAKAASKPTYTAAEVGAVPTTRKVNGKALSADITLSASDVSARPSTWTPTATDVGAKASTWKPFVAQATQPSDTTVLWIDTTPNTGGLKYYNGSAWVHVPVAYT